MPKIYDNIESQLKNGLITTLESSYRADFCVGYFNLRGWKLVENQIDLLEGGEDCCRLLVGMQRPEEELLRSALSRIDEGMMDNSRALDHKKKIARSFRQQLTFGLPTAKDEESLQKLKQQLVHEKVKVKLFLDYPLHAKLYLLHRKDKLAPLIGYVGSSNLTMAGLSGQGELNVDVLEQDAAQKLANWFEDRWNDRWCLDISKELIEILDESWASDKLIPPYYIYLKMAYHLSQEARSGVNDYIIPRDLRDELLPFQASAVSIAARHLDKRGGVLIGDVVGLGKTLTATAIAKLFEETFFTETLIICPKNLTTMWEDYVHRYGLRAKVVSISMINQNFSEKTRRYRVVIIDESHNLRNRQAKRYAWVKEYIEKNESRVIMLTATPYNKNYQDLSNQLRLFIPEDKDIGISPELFVESMGGATEFIAKYQYLPSTLLAFEKSYFSEDWQELLKTYMVRRTRTFIKTNYAKWDGDRKQHYIPFSDGSNNYFPEREPKKVQYKFDENDPTDIYVKLYSTEVVDKINSLHLARYGLGNYLDPNSEQKPTKEEEKIMDNLSQAGKRLMGFCRTNLFKRLESSGSSFLISLARHIARNYLFLCAIEKGMPFPIGQQESADMDEFLEEDDSGGENTITLITDRDKYRQLAEKHYNWCQNDKNKFDWISSKLFMPELARWLQEDIDTILSIIEIGKHWDPTKDRKLNALEKLLTKDHKQEKVLVFTQFADTARYLEEQLVSRGISDLECVTGAVNNPTEYAYRFSPKSNRVKDRYDEIRVLISTDVLSEGQNLQDAHIIVNYDLPWALIRLIQRAGRVDRIGQEAPKILCYSFLPQDGLEKIINLRNRLTKRISENSEVVGSDETFFDGDPVNIADLYNEKAGILDEDEGEIDLTSQAFEIWNQAIMSNPKLKKIIPNLPDVVYSTKPLMDLASEGEGVITYSRSSHGMEGLTWLDDKGRIISRSQSRILKAAACSSDTQALERLEQHHELVARAVELAEREAVQTGGQLGSQASARYRAYKMLKRYHESIEDTLFDTTQLKRTIDDIYRYPLKESARELINRRIRFGISDEEMAEMLIKLRDESRLSVIEQKHENVLNTPQIVCSLGMKARYYDGLH
jgi:superfamily II DNA or RNA helicase